MNSHHVHSKGSIIGNSAVEEMTATDLFLSFFQPWLEIGNVTAACQMCATDIFKTIKLAHNGVAIVV